MGHPKLCYVLVRNRDQTGTVSGIVPARNNVGPVSEHFLFRSQNILFVLSKTIVTVSLSAPPTVAHIRR